jgi:hypothetical protein
VVGGHFSHTNSRPGVGAGWWEDTSSTQIPVQGWGLVIERRVYLHNSPRHGLARFSRSII